jgi:hypothetical protein
MIFKSLIAYNDRKCTSESRQLLVRQDSSNVFCFTGMCDNCAFSKEIVDMDVTGMFVCSSTECLSKNRVLQ